MFDAAEKMGIKAGWVWSSVAAVLSLMLILTGFSRMASNRNSASAAALPELRVWFEPSNLVLNANEIATVKVIAEYNSRTTVLPGLWVAIDQNKSLNIYTNRLSYSQPFRGDVVLGNLNISGGQTGKYTVTVNKEDLVKQLKDNPVIIAPLEVTIR